eukprot:2657139-Rhodomonas_salina.1
MSALFSKRSQNSSVADTCDIPRLSLARFESELTDVRRYRTITDGYTPGPMIRDCEPQALSLSLSVPSQAPSLSASPSPGATFFSRLLLSRYSPCRRQSSSSSLLRAPASFTDRDGHHDSLSIVMVLEVSGAGSRSPSH